MSKQSIDSICVKLKCGEYDGVDIMEARIYLQELECENAELKRIIAESNKPKPSRIHSCDIEGCAVCDPTYGL